MKKIGIDARLYSQTGVGTYLRNFIYELSLLDIKDMNFHLYILPQDRSILPVLPSHFMIHETPYKWHTIGEQIGYLKDLQRDKLDLMHFTYFGYPMFYKRKFIATVHDLTPLLFKTGKASSKNQLLYYVKHLFFQQVLRSQLFNAQLVITPTNAVKQQIVQQYGPSINNRTHVCYEGVNRELINTEENKNLVKQFSTPFFIYVGNFYPHKNIERLLLGFKNAKTNHKLILIGPKDYFAHSIQGYLSKLGLTKKVMFYHGATSSDLVFFYKHACALIHPSLSEGFGLPLIEASYYKCPIIASNTNVFKELLGDKYQSFNPYEEKDIKRAIISFITSNKKNNFTTPTKQFSFKNMTAQTLALYRKVLTS